MIFSTPERSSSLSLRDGRRLAWSEWGRENDQPVLFCTGAGMSSTLGFGIETLNQLGVRLINVDRPGLGRSSMHSTKSFESWNQDIAELLQFLELPSCRAVGFSQGAPFAYSLASSGLVDALAIVAGQDDFSNSSVQSKLPQEVASFVSQFRTGNREFIEAFSTQASAEGIWNLVASMSSTNDRAFLSNPEFAKAYRQSLSEGFGQGSLGYVKDLELTFGSWPFEIEHIECRVELWYGTLDASSVHSPDFGATLARRLPNCRHHLLDEAGGFVLWTHSKKILQSLLEE